MSKHDNRRIATFSVGGPLGGYYLDLRVDQSENDSQETTESIIRSWLSEHFPKDWASTYLVPDGEEQVYKYRLIPLHRGRIEHFEGRNIFHEDSAIDNC